jgi:hypothetical protein
VTSPTNPDGYEFQEQDFFRRDRERLIAEGISEQEFDSHLFSIQDCLRPDPFAEFASVPLLTENPGNRVAISDATPAEPNALRVVFRVEGQLIKLWRVARRD